ncbi:MAG: hypothetical protein KIT43_10990 [Bauldia sp.]|nr:hypothetical protein [Bauldia sp.]MCW5717632.1 hypothetical protein [Bauldia sp.]
MLSLKIRVFAGTQETTTVSIPLRFVRTAARLVPQKAMASLQEQGIDIAELVRLSEDPEARGEVAVIEDHTKGTRTVVSIE